MRYTLSNEFQLIDEGNCILQNVSNDANVEISNSTSEQGIILPPYALVSVNKQVYAHKISGNGTCTIAILSLASSSDEDSSDSSSGSDSDDSSYYTDLQPNHRPHPPKHHHHLEPPPPPPVIRMPPPRPPRPWEHNRDSIMVEIPRSEIEKGNNKFFIDFSK